MGDRKGDVRMYVISIFFFACTIGGGIFLCIYILLPDAEAVPAYLFAGMTLVAIPWLSWFLIFIYRCIRPHVGHQNNNNNNRGGNNATIWTPKTTQTDVPPVVTSPSGVKSPVHSPGGGERHVQFGAVVEMGNGFGGGDEEQHHNEDQWSKEEQEKPTLVLVEH
ncbi:hypothetical protein TSUD_354290 [Trifolium subterraneum]|uniref:Uncharacterized protein n=1 Tax=Trifolium subterraneum TaxID=3900 RepID=A0A2Z6NAD4_TRISU|nr:hypothetical protein TSUD_354290 [Trifolium subterraneum]